MKYILFALICIASHTLLAQNETSYPVFRGCNEKLDFESLKKCTTEKIIDYIKVSFDYELADKIFPLEQSTQFQVDFTINEKGKVEDVNAKAHHKAIAIEAIKLVKRMPKLKKPGFKDGKPIDTPMSIMMTIYFQ